MAVLLCRYAAKFGPDVTLLAQGDASGTCRCSSLTFLPVLHVVEAVAAGRRPMMMASQVGSKCTVVCLAASQVGNAPCLGLPARVLAGFETLGISRMHTLGEVVAQFGMRAWWFVP